MMWKFIVLGLLLNILFVSAYHKCSNRDDCGDIKENSDEESSSGESDSQECNGSIEDGDDEDDDDDDNDSGDDHNDEIECSSLDSDGDKCDCVTTDTPDIQREHICCNRFTDVTAQRPTSDDNDDDKTLENTSTSDNYNCEDITSTYDTTATTDDSTSEAETETSTATEKVATTIEDVTTSIEETNTSTEETTTSIEETTTSTEEKPTSTEKITTTTEVPQCIDTISAIKRATVELTQKLLYEIVKTNQKQTIIVSPISLKDLFIAVILYSEGKTRSVVSKALNVNGDDIDKIRCSIVPTKKYIENLSPDAGQFLYGFVIAANNQFNFSKLFLKDIKDVFGYHALNLNFENQEESVNILNEAVASATNNSISHVIPSANILNSNIELAYIGYTFFKTSWRYTHDPKTERVEDFLAGPFNIKRLLYGTLTLLLEYTYSPKLRAKIFLIPLKDANESLHIIYPDSPLGAEKLLKTLQNTDLYYSAIASLKEVNAELRLPVINNITSQVDIRDVLEKLKFGPELFDSKTTQFKNLVDQDVPVSISVASEKTIAIFTKDGAQQQNYIPKPFEKKINIQVRHPFVFFVVAKGYVRFGGVFRGST